MIIKVGKTYRAKKPILDFRGNPKDRIVVDIFSNGRVLWDGETSNNSAYLPECSMETFKKWAGKEVPPPNRSKS